jgi:hypothetical protein
MRLNPDAKIIARTLSRIAVQRVLGRLDLAV